MSNPHWEFIEPGWWTHDTLGGVVRVGSNKWGCYPRDLPDDAPAHTEKTMCAAMRWIEQRAKSKMHWIAFLKPNAGREFPAASAGKLHGVVGSLDSET